MGFVVERSGCRRGLFCECERGSVGRASCDTDGEEVTSRAVVSRTRKLSFLVSRARAEKRRHGEGK